MKVLYFSHIYPSQIAPTRGIYCHNILKAISRHCETKAFVPEACWLRFKHPQDLFTTPRETFEGIDIISPTYWSLPRLPFLHARAMSLSLRTPLQRLHKEFPFDIILACWAYPDAVAASYMAHKLNCPVVVRTFGSDINDLVRYPLLRRQMQQGLGEAQRVIAVSSALQEKIRALGIAPHKVIVQHNGVNGEDFRIRDRNATCKQLGISSSMARIVYVGRLGHEKGIDVLIEAMAHLVASGRQEVELAIIGSGEMEASLKSRVQQHSLESSVRFYGARPHEEIPLWLSASHIVCLPSRREGCPNVVLEALACGKPVVASEVGGVPELLDARNGILVPPDNSLALAEGLQQALDRVWDAPSLRSTVEYLSWNAVGDSYYSTLCTALAEWKNPSKSTQKVMA